MVDNTEELTDRSMLVVKQVSPLTPKRNLPKGKDSRLTRKDEDSEESQSFGSSEDGDP